MSPIVEFDPLMLESLPVEGVDAVPPVMPVVPVPVLPVVPMPVLPLVVELLVPVPLAVPLRCEPVLSVGVGRTVAPWVVVALGGVVVVPVVPMVPVVEELPVLIAPPDWPGLPAFGPVVEGLLLGEPEAPPAPPLVPVPDWAKAPPHARAAAAARARILEDGFMEVS